MQCLNKKIDNMRSPLKHSRIFNTSTIHKCEINFKQHTVFTTSFEEQQVLARTNEACNDECVNEKCTA